MIKFEVDSTTPVVLAKAFKAEEGVALSAEIAGAFALADKKVVIIDHPPTAGLVPLIEGLMAAGAEVSLRDHHGDSDRDGQTVARCRELLSDGAVISTRALHPACATLVRVGEFRDCIIVADADQDGLTAALKAAGVMYPGLDEDAAILDGPHTGKTKAELSPLGFLLVRAWGAIPAFGARDRDAMVAQVAASFAIAVQGHENALAELEALAEKYERKVVSAKALAATATEPFAGFRIVSVPQGAEYDPPTLASEMDRGVLVSARIVLTGPIAKVFGSQVSLARTKAGEAKVDLSTLVPSDWAKGPEAGGISNTPFLLHLSPARWEEFRSILLAALAQ